MGQSGSEKEKARARCVVFARAAVAARVAALALAVSVASCPASPASQFVALQHSFPPLFSSSASSQGPVLRRLSPFCCHAIRILALMLVSLRRRLC